MLMAIRAGWSFGKLFTRDPIELAPAPTRDLRLDFFRGFALIFIFLDHIPSNLVNWVTIRNYGFSDAAEIFVFVSGYAAALAYGATMRRSGFWLATARILRRCWQLYVAHIFLFVIFTAQIAYVTARFNNPMFVEEMQTIHFLNDPNVALVQALLLKFRPANLDILPLYIVLLLAFPITLWGLERRSVVVLMISALLYVIVQATHVNFPSYPPGEGWFFNPLAWQFLFVIGALLGRAHGSAVPIVPRHPILLWVAGAYLMFSFLIVMSWHIPQLKILIPGWIDHILYPIRKTDLDLLRLFSFLAWAYVTVSLVEADSRFLSWRVCQPVIRCGQQSLYVFCVGIVLSFSGHFFLVEVNDSFGMQLLVSVTGTGLMVALAYLLSWYRRMDRADSSARGRKTVGSTAQE